MYYTLIISLHLIIYYVFSTTWGFAQREHLEITTTNCPLIPVKDMKKTHIRTYNTAFDGINAVFISRWNGNSVVSIGNNRDASDSPTSDDILERIRKTTTNNIYL